MPQPFGGDITLYSSTQIPHILKVMVAVTLGIPEHQMRVIAPAVGGGFGSKLNVYAEELLCVALARKHGVPVRWNETRSENTVATIHGRGQIQHIELAADADGKLTAVRVRLIADMGAYLQLVTPGHPAARRLPVRRRVRPAEGVRLLVHRRCSPTMTPTDAYRGAGRPEATYAIERAMDSLAAEDRRRPARAAPAQLHPQGPVPVRGVHRARLRLRRPRRGGHHRRRHDRLRRRARPPGRTERRRAPPSGSGSAMSQLLRDVRPRPVAGARLAQLLGRRLGGGDRARAADRQGAGGHRHRRPTARDTRRRGR